MAFEIDQSGKIEQTAKDTILCLSNRDWYAVLIPRKTKRQLQEIFRRRGQMRNFVLFTFCAGLAILLRRASPKKKVLIDEEYPSKKAIIINILHQMLGRAGLTPLEFRRIGKRSHAHYLAKEIARGHKEPTLILNLNDLLREIKMTEVGKRLKDA